MPRMTFLRSPGPDTSDVPDEGTWIDVGSDRDLRELGRLVVDAPILGEEVVVMRTRRGVFAFANRCPHRRRRLEDATTRRGAIICAGHGWRFRLDTGECRDAANMHRLRLFEAACVHGRVRIRVPADDRQAPRPTDPDRS
jgi:nitrite reductase/ring-hydroxylating ferredoxin subunit